MKLASNHLTVTNTMYLSMLIVLTNLLGFIGGQPSGTAKELNRCRQMCYQKFIEDWHHCMDFEDCKNMCITPPNINSYIPEAFSFLCWNSCDQTLGPFPLNVQSASRQGSLIITDIAWDQAITNASKQCLVTWEVSGGGLMGNLLTDSSTVELSLWSDTVYHVQVTCKNKETGGMRRSYKLIVDTRKLTGASVLSSTMQSIDIDPNHKSTSIPQLLANEEVETEADAQKIKILKDSSKDLANSRSSSFVNQQQQQQQLEEIELQQQEMNNYPNDLDKIVPISHKTTILHSKLSSDGLTSTSSLSSTFDYSSELLSRSILFILMGSLALLLGIVIAFLIVRHRRDTSTHTDKQNLINNEQLPDSRTLHV